MSFVLSDYQIMSSVLFLISITHYETGWQVHFPYAVVTHSSGPGSETLYSSVRGIISMFVSCDEDKQNPSTWKTKTLDIYTHNFGGIGEFIHNLINS